MSETKQNINEQPNDDEQKPIDPPPYTDPPTIPVTNQPQMSVAYATYPGTMTVVAAGFIMHNQMMYTPTPYQCKSCHQQIVTKVKRKPTIKTHLFAASLCLVCFIPCAVIPYFVDQYKQADHYCPNCDTFIGSYVP